MGKKDKKSEKPEDALFGSSIQPSHFELEDGTTVQLGDVVRQAYEDYSDAQTADEWNAIPEETRDAMIQAVVNTLNLKTAADENAPDLTGLIKMRKGGSHIHAHPDVVKHHEGNGWKVA
jgi:hypothetical protein